MTLATRSPLWPIQKAIYARLDADLTESVYDHVPEGQDTKPWVVVGGDTAQEFNTTTEPGYEVFIEVSVWSEYRGREEAKELIDSIIQSVTGTALDLSADNWAALTVIVDEIDSDLTLADGETRNDTVTFRVLVFDES